MDRDSSQDARIVSSWHRNAAPWTDAIRAGRIESRRRVTDRAVVDAVCARNPRTVLDIGCGEGWLLRALRERGIDGVGIDVVPELIDAARSAGCADCRLLSYTALAEHGLDVRVDVALCNFSLLGDGSVADVLKVVPALLNPGGALIVQTLHPLMACGDEPYRDGWREGSWVGLPKEVAKDFVDAAPWYFRTIESWVDLLTACGFVVRALHEPLHPDIGKPASVLFVAEPR